MIAFLAKSAIEDAQHLGSGPVATDFASALVAEIGGLERQLEADPRYVKLRELRRVLTMYEPMASTRDLSPRAPPAGRKRAASGRSASPQRQAILQQARAMIAGRTTPTPTSEIFDMMMLMDGSINNT